MQIIPSKLLFNIAAHATAYATIFSGIGGVLLFFRADFPPFASMTRAEELSHKIDETGVQLRGSVARLDTTNQALTITLLDVLISNWEQRLRDALKDREANPNSQSARDAVAVAEAKLKKLRAKQDALADKELIP